MIAKTVEASVEAEILDPKGKFGLDDTIVECDGEVNAVSVDGVLANVHPSFEVCPHCILECSARMDL